MKRNESSVEGSDEDGAVQEVNKASASDATTERKETMQQKLKNQALLKAESYTYTITYHWGTDESKTESRKSTKNEYAFAVYTRAAQWAEQNNRLEEGYRVVGWATEENATETEYKPGDTIDLTNESPNIDLYPVYEQMDLVETQIGVLYLDESLPDGYKVSELTTESFQCLNYNLTHPVSGMHKVNTNDIYEKLQSVLEIEDGYEVLGMIKDNVSATPKLMDLEGTTTISFSEGTFYLVVQKVEEPESKEVTYSVKRHIYGSDKVEETTKTTDAESYTVTLPKLPFQIEDYKAKLEEGYKLVGWSETEGAETAEYGLGAKVVLTREKPVVDLYPVYGQMDLFEITVNVLYLDDSVEGGYKTGEGVVGNFQCINYAVNHPEDGYMHQIRYVNLYQQAQQYVSVEEGYELVGMTTKAASANPEMVDVTSTETIHFSKGNTIYLVAKKVEEPEPEEVTYSVKRHIYGSDKVEETTKTTDAESYT
ncbi:MAG: hypothetical protein Q4D90_10655, partial [bacterium]|nr:hypothetical protein [bacterium]